MSDSDADGQKMDHAKRQTIKLAGAGAIVAVSGAGLLEAAPTDKAARRAVPTALIQRIIHSGWSLRQASGEAQVKGNVAATVPGTVHTDLYAGGKIDDPFFRNNEHDLQWIDKLDWEYETRFDADDALLACERIELEFAGIDTFATVRLNGAEILVTDNMFRTWRVDVAGKLVPGANSLSIYFRSPITVGREKIAALGYGLPATNDQSQVGGMGDEKVAMFTRKAQYHYGWDWGPRFVTSGIWRPVTLNAWRHARLRDVQVVQKALSPRRAELELVAEIDAIADGPAEVVIASPTDARIRVRQQVMLKRGANRIVSALRIDNPELWWPNGLGKAHLYAIDTEIVIAGQVADRRSVTTGLRTLRLVREKDAIDGRAGKSFLFEVNGVRIFAKGANTIPNDSFLPRVTPQIYERMVSDAVDANMNMLRVWGGGIYEDDAFYDACDRGGILVWQDFMFACAMYPGDPAFLDTVRHEAIDNIKRLRNHPCMALWCGNNENDTGWQHNNPDGGWLSKERYTPAQQADMWRWYEAIFHEMLPQLIDELDPARAYWPSSPMADWAPAPNPVLVHQDINSHMGDIHYWDVLVQRLPRSAWRTSIGRFMSEWGFQAFPDARTIETYTLPQDRYIASPVLLGHLEPTLGTALMTHYMGPDYGIPTDYRKFLYITQVLQADIYRSTIEAHRNAKPYCMGSLYWMLNDCMPVASWSTSDYFGRRKASHHAVRKAFAPLIVTSEVVGEADARRVIVRIVSDELRARRGTLLLRLTDFDGAVLWSEDKPVEVAANGPPLTIEYPFAAIMAQHDPRTVMLRATLDGRGLAGPDGPIASELYFTQVKNLVLPMPDIAVTATQAGADVRLTLKSARLAKNLFLDTGTTEGYFSDNYFDLLPGTPRTILFSARGRMSADTLRQQLKLFHMAQAR